MSLESEQEVPSPTPSLWASLTCKRASALHAQAVGECIKESDFYLLATSFSVPGSRQRRSHDSPARSAQCHVELLMKPEKLQILECTQNSTSAQAI